MSEAATSFFSKLPALWAANPYMAAIQGIGSILGGIRTDKIFKEGQDTLAQMPGMEGPAQLGGMFGQYIGNNFVGNAGTASMQNALGMTAPQLLQGMGSQDLSGAMDNLSMAPAAQYANDMLSQQFGPMNAGALASSPALLNAGFGNMLAAGDSQALQQQQYDALMARAQPGRDRAMNSLTTRLGNMGLLGPNTDVESSNALSRTLANEFGQQDLDFQREAFNQGLARQQFLGNLGMQQVGQGLGAENQAFNQGFQAFGRNQDSALQRLAAAQGLFGLDQDTFAKQYGLGLQGVESMNNLNLFGLQAARSPYELQAQLLSGSQGHADAAQQLTRAYADANSSFFGGLFG